MAEGILGPVTFIVPDRYCCPSDVFFFSEKRCELEVGRRAVGTGNGAGNVKCGKQAPIWPAMKLRDRRPTHEPALAMGRGRRKGCTRQSCEALVRDE